MIDIIVEIVVEIVDIVVDVVEIFDIVDTVDIVDIVEIVDMVDIVDIGSDADHELTFQIFSDDVEDSTNSEPKRDKLALVIALQLKWGSVLPYVGRTQIL